MTKQNNNDSVTKNKGSVHVNPNKANEAINDIHNKQRAFQLIHRGINPLKTIQPSMISYAGTSAPT